MGRNLVLPADKPFRRLQPLHRAPHGATDRQWHVGRNRAAPRGGVLLSKIRLPTLTRIASVELPQDKSDRVYL
jgi:hypothetical protein